MTRRIDHRQDTVKGQLKRLGHELEADLKKDTKAAKKTAKKEVKTLEDEYDRLKGAVSQEVRNFEAGVGELASSASRKVRATASGLASLMSDALNGTVSLAKKAYQTELGAAKKIISTTESMIEKGRQEVLDSIDQVKAA